jgi:hypothetical protein
MPACAVALYRVLFDKDSQKQYALLAQLVKPLHVNAKL